jgi:ring-1,2-phenylacetyl-CoA epoxidase subunit PaaC
MAEDPRRTLLLALADDELVIGHRHSEWTGWAPHIEEDLAFSSIAQDEIAHARLLYELAAELDGGADGAVDAVALGRSVGDYRHAVICERPNGGWGRTIARQYLYDTADAVRLGALAGSSWKDLADRVRLMQLEERYHLDHAGTWFERLANGPVEARQHYADGLASTVGEAMALFEPFPGEDELVSEGVLPRSNEELLAQWLEGLGSALESVGLDWILSDTGGEAGEMVPTSSGEVEAAPTITVPGLVHRDGRWAHQGGFAGEGGRLGRHTEDFVALWDEMTALYRAHPGASW